MSDEQLIAPTPTPLWKREALKRAEAKRAKASVKQALMNAFDKLGNEAFFLRLGNGSPEDRRCLAMIYAKLIPLEIHGELDHSLTVKIVKQVGDQEVVIDGRTGKTSLNVARDAATGKSLPRVGHQLIDVDA